MNAPTQNEYLLLIRGTAWYSRLSPEQLQSAMDQFKGWFDRLGATGKLKAAQPLAREGAVVTKGRVLADGPYPESKEAIGGYFLLQADHIDEAIALAKTFPGLEYGTQIEVRPVDVECPMAARARQFAPEEQLATA